MMASGVRRATGWTSTVVAVAILLAGLTAGGTALAAHAGENARSARLSPARGMVADSPHSLVPDTHAKVADPSVNVPEPAGVLDYCTRTRLDDSVACIEALLSAIDAARAAEGVGPMQLDAAAFATLSVPEQLFVVANLERIDRGLAPLTGMTGQLDADAQAGAEARDDPQLNFTSLTGGTPLRAGGSNWAGGFADALEADYFWMYDDGYQSPNVDCPKPGAAGCWGHREDLLYAPVKCPDKPSLNVMGAAFSDSGESSFAEVFASACGPAPSDLVFTWSDAEAALARAGQLQILAAPAGLPQASPGGSYSTMLDASGGTAPYSWTVTSGTLPAGFALAPNGDLVGNPTIGEAGAYTFTAEVADSSGTTSTETFTLTVVAATKGAPAGETPGDGQVLSPHLHAREVVRPLRRERSVLLVVTVARSRHGRTITVDKRSGGSWTELTRLRTSASGHARLRLKYATRRAPRLRVVVTPSGRYRGEVRRAGLKVVVRHGR